MRVCEFQCMGLLAVIPVQMDSTLWVLCLSEPSCGAPEWQASTEDIEIGHSSKATDRPSALEMAPGGPNSLRKTSAVR